MHDTEVVGMRALERAELLAHEYVGLGDVRIEQREARAVRGVRQGVVDDLVEGRDARAAADQRDLLKLVRFFFSLSDTHV